MDDRQQDFRDYNVPDPPRIEKVARYVRSFFPAVSGLRVLECGATRGGLAERLSAEGAQCYGVDLYPRDIPGVEVMTADLNAGLPQPNEPYDCVFAGELIEHLYDDERFLRECHRALRPGGLLALTTPNLVFLVNRFRMLFGKTPLFAHQPFHYHFYTKRVLEDVVKNAGFELRRTVSTHVLFSSRLHPSGRVFEWLGDVAPSLGAHLILFARRP